MQAPFGRPLQWRKPGRAIAASLQVNRYNLQAYSPSSAHRGRTSGPPRHPCASSRRTQGLNKSQRQSDRVHGQRAPAGGHTCRRRLPPSLNPRRRPADVAAAAAWGAERRSGESNMAAPSTAWPGHPANMCTCAAAAATASRTSARPGLEWAAAAVEFGVRHTPAAATPAWAVHRIHGQQHAVACQALNKLCRSPWRRVVVLSCRDGVQSEEVAKLNTGGSCGLAAA